MVRTFEYAINGKTKIIDIITDEKK